MAARFAAGASLADVMDGDDASKQRGGVSSWLDLFNELALMVCLGWKPLHITAYYAGMLVMMYVITTKIMAWIPDDLFKSCTLCVGPKHAQQCRKGECKRNGKIMEIVLGVVAALIAFGIVRSLLRWYLKFRVYNLFVDGFVRSVA